MEALCYCRERRTAGKLSGYTVFTPDFPKILCGVGATYVILTELRRLTPLLYPGLCVWARRARLKQQRWRERCSSHSWLSVIFLGLDSTTHHPISFKPYEFTAEPCTRLDWDIRRQQRGRAASHRHPDHPRTSPLSTIRPLSFRPLPLARLIFLITNSHNQSTCVMFHAALAITLALLAPAVRAQGDLSAANNVTDLEGTWSSNVAISTGGVGATLQLSCRSREERGWGGCRCISPPDSSWGDQGSSRGHLPWPSYALSAKESNLRAIARR